MVENREIEKEAKRLFEHITNFKEEVFVSFIEINKEKLIQLQCKNWYVDIKDDLKESWSLDDYAERLLVPALYVLAGKFGYGINASMKS